MMLIIPGTLTEKEFARHMSSWGSLDENVEEKQALTQRLSTAEKEQKQN